MSFEVEKKEKYVLLTVTSERFDITISPDIKTAVIEFQKEGVKNIIFDLKKTKYCDSSALSSIIVANRVCEKAKGSFILCNASDMVKKLIKVSQLDNIIQMTPTLNEAKDYLFMEELERDLDEGNGNEDNKKV